MKPAIEVIPLVVKVQNLGILDQESKRSAHQLGVVPDHLVENLAMILGELEE
jgi:hypothetical protein